MGLFIRVWKWFSGRNEKKFELANLPNESKFFYFAFQGTSMDDRQWMQGLR